MSLFAGQPALASPSDPLVSQDDFTEWYGITDVSSSDAARIQTALEIASAQIRNGRRLFDPIVGEMITVDAYGGDTLLLPRSRLPVTGVTLVEQLSGAAYVTVDSTQYDWSADGYLRRYWSCWTDRPQGVRVTYSHGYAVLPREVAGVCLTLAGRIYNNPDNSSIQSEQLGDHHVTYQGVTGGLSSEEQNVLSQYEARA